MTEERFLDRWSRRKAASRRPEPEPPAPRAAPAQEEPPPAEAEPAAGAPPAEKPQDVPPPELPPIESLTRESDFTPFLKPGVPEALKKAALQKLWRSDPSWAGPEVLDLHNLDYTLPTVPEVVRTAYRVGKGILDAAERAAEEAEAKEKAAAGEKTTAEDGEEEPPAGS